MADTNVLQDFLIKLGFKVDDVQFRKGMESIEKFGKEIAKVAVAAEAASLTVVAGLGAMARSFEAAYLSASRTGSSIQEMKRFAYAASQLGSSADEAVAAVESLSKMMRVTDSPSGGGIASMLKNLEVTNTKDATKALEQLLQSLDKKPLIVAEAYASSLNIPEHLMLAHRNNSAAFDKFGDEYDRKTRAMGLDPEKAGADAQKLTQSFRSLAATFDNLQSKVGADLFKKLQPGLDHLNDFLTQHGDEISKVIVKIADALLKMFTTIVENLPAFDKFVDKMGGWQIVLEAIGLVLLTRVVPGLTAMIAAVRTLVAIALPTWALRMLGVSVAGVAASMAYGEAQGFSPEARAALAAEGAKGGGGSLMDRVKRRLGFGGNDALRRRGHQQVQDATNYTGDNANVTRQAASALGTTPENLAMVIGYETGGTFSPDKWGGAGGNYMGLIQFGPAERRQFGVHPGMTYAEQMRSVVSYLKTRGYKPGMGLKDLYSTINAGSPGHYNASDGHGTVSSHVDKMLKEQSSNVVHFLGSGGKDGIVLPKLTNPLAVSPSSFAPTLGAGPQSMNDNRIHMAPNTTINVSGVGDPHAAAAQVASNMTRQHANLLRNLQSAIG